MQKKMLPNIIFREREFTHQSLILSCILGFQICCPNPKQTICLPGDITCDPNTRPDPDYEPEYDEYYEENYYNIESYDDQDENVQNTCNFTKPIQECSENDFNQMEPPYHVEFDKGKLSASYGSANF